MGLTVAEGASTNVFWFDADGALNTPAPLIETNPVQLRDRYNSHDRVGKKRRSAPVKVFDEELALAPPNQPGL